jgi:hypothetical protein
MLFLPRQARDKHRENSKKEAVLLQLGPGHAAGKKKTVLLSTWLIKMMIIYFIKTSLAQT